MNDGAHGDVPGGKGELISSPVPLVTAAPALVPTHPDQGVDDGQVGAAACATAVHADSAEGSAADRLLVVLRADIAAAKAPILRNASKRPWRS